MTREIKLKMSNKINDLLSSVTLYVLRTYSHVYFFFHISAPGENTHRPTTITKVLLVVIYSITFCAPNCSQCTQGHSVCQPCLLHRTLIPVGIRENDANATRRVLPDE